MDQRLSLIKNMVKPCHCVADVGTDHGLLVVALVADGIAKSGVATDINEMPLQKAIDHIANNAMENRIKALLTDGLQGVDNTADAVAIAGMGGELIWRIISSWEHAKSTDKHYYLQPMTKPEYLREQLFINGFDIIKEECCVAVNRPYSVMEVKYVGKETPHSLIDCYMGKISKPYSEDTKKYINKLLRKLTDKINGIKQSATENSELEKWETLYKQIEELVKDESNRSL